VVDERDERREELLRVAAAAGGTGADADDPGAVDDRGRELRASDVDCEHPTHTATIGSNGARGSPREDVRANASTE
jgi:hypothetical protein